MQCISEIDDLSDYPSIDTDVLHSTNVAAIQAVVSAGLAAMICMESLVTEDLRVLGSDEGFPPLPSMHLHLLRNPQITSPITECLADYIFEGFRL